MSEMTEERLAGLTEWFALEGNGDHWVKAAAGELLKEVKRLRAELAAAKAENERLHEEVGSLVLAARLEVAKNEDLRAGRDDPFTGIGRIGTERRRQVAAEGWTPEHDKQYEFGQLLNAAVCYALSDPAGWPWDMKWWKPSENTVRNLEKAGALIAAEIDRLLALNPEPAP